MLIVNNAVVGVSYNGAPAGQPHCIDVGCLLDEVNHGPHCIRCAHAEMNVLLGAAAIGVSTKGGTLCVTHQPCRLCSTMISRAGVARVLFDKFYGGLLNIEYLRSMNVKVEVHSLGEYHYE